MFELFLIYIFTIIPLIVLDVVWVGYVAMPFYRSQVGHLLGPIRLLGALGFYAIYSLGISLFVVSQFLDDLTATALYGGLLGLTAYSVYNFSNHATLNNWTFKIVIVDICAGVIITALVAIASHSLINLVI